MHFVSITDLFALLALGATLGFFGGVFGIGGGIIAIPVLAIGFGMEQAMAQGTSLAMMVPILAVGLWRYSRKHPIPWRVAVYIGLLASVTTYVVALFATRLDPKILQSIFGAFLVLLSIHMLIGKHTASPAQDTSRINLRLMPVVGVLAGTSMGLLGVGGGLVATPCLTGLFGQRQATAQSLSMAMVTPCAIVGLLTYNHTSDVDWSVGLPLAIGGLLTVSAGVAVAHRLPEKRMRKAFAAMLLVTAVWLLIKPYLMH